MMEIKLYNDGYFLEEYKMLQREPYIPHVVKHEDGTTDYYNSAVEHYNILKNIVPQTEPPNPIEVAKEELRLEFAQSNAELFETILALQGGTENV